MLKCNRLSINNIVVIDRFEFIEDEGSIYLEFIFESNFLFFENLVNDNINIFELTKLDDYSEQTDLINNLFEGSNIIFSKLINEDKGYYLKIQRTK